MPTANSSLPPHAWRSARGRLATTAMVWGFGAARIRALSGGADSPRERVAAAPAAAPAAPGASQSR